MKYRGLCGVLKRHLTLLCLLFGCFSCDHIRADKDIAEFAGVPQDALWIMRFENMKSLRAFCEKESAFGSILYVVDSTWLEQEASFEHWMREVPYLSNLAEGAFSISAHPIGTQANLLFSFPQKEEEVSLMPQFTEKGFRIEKIEQSEGTIFQLTTPAGDLFFATYVAKRLLFSRSRILIEGSLHQVKAGYSLASSHDFAYAYKQADMDQPITVFINVQGLSQMIQPVYRAAAVNWIQNLHQLGKWMVADVDKQDRNFAFEGILTHSPAEISISQVWMKKEEFRLPVWESLPATVKQAWVESVRKSDHLVTQMVQYREKQSKSGYRLPQITQQLIAPKEVSAFVQEWDPQSLCLANVVMGDGVDVWMTSMRCGRVEAYRKAVVEALGNYKNMSQLGDMHLSRTCAIDSAGGNMRIYVNPFKALYPYVYGELYTLAADAYVGFYGDYAIIGPTPVAIVEWVQALRKARTLGEVAYMQTIRDESETKAVVFYFLRPDVQRTPWINELLPGRLKKLSPAAFDLKWGGMWMRIRKDDDYLRLEGEFLGRGETADTLHFSNALGQPLMK